jgi:hypothetical protein
MPLNEVAEKIQSPARLLEYEPAERFAELRRRRRRGWAVIALALLFAVLMFAANYREIRSDVARWQRERALARVMAKPASERFVDGEVTYAVPPGFHSRTSGSFPATPATYGPLSASAAAASAELKGITGIVPRGPVVFLGALVDPAGERALVAIAFDNCSIRLPPVRPSPGSQGGYYVALSYAWQNLRGRGQSAGGGFPGTRLAPLSALNWKYKSQDEEVAALPLTLYGSRVDPADPRVAVIPIKLGERRGRLRAWLNSTGGLSTEVVWDE